MKAPTWEPPNLRLQMFQKFCYFWNRGVEWINLLLQTPREKPVPSHLVDFQRWFSLGFCDTSSSLLQKSLCLDCSLDGVHEGRSNILSAWWRGLPHDWWSRSGHKGSLRRWSIKSPNRSRNHVWRAHAGAMRTTSCPSSDTIVMFTQLMLRASTPYACSFSIDDMYVGS